MLALAELRTPLHVQAGSLPSHSPGWPVLPLMPRTPLYAQAGWLLTSLYTWASPLFILCPASVLIPRSPIVLWSTTYHEGGAFVHQVGCGSGYPTASPCAFSCDSMNQFWTGKFKLAMKYLYTSSHCLFLFHHFPEGFYSYDCLPTSQRKLDPVLWWASCLQTLSVKP